jgi:transcriptional regulator with XRE-family HTH domain
MLPKVGAGRLLRMARKQTTESTQQSRVILAVNLKRLMQETPALNTHEKLGKAASVAPRSISNMCTPKVGNPTLDNVTKIANAFNLEAWQLLHPDLPGRVLKPSEAQLYNVLRDALAAITKK